MNAPDEVETRASPSRGLPARLRAVLDDAFLRRLVARAGPNTLATLASAVLGMVRSAILVRALGLVDFGLLAVIIAASSLVRQTFSVRTWEWTTVELAVAHVRTDPVRLRAVARAGALLGLVTSVLAVATIAGTAAFGVFGGDASRVLGPLLAVYGVVHLMTAFDDVSMATLRTAGWFPFLARYQFGAAALRVLTTLPLLIPGAGLWAAVGATLAAQLPASLWLWAGARRAFGALLPESPSADPLPDLRSEWRRHAKTLATLSVTDSVKTVALDADPVIVDHFGSATDVGVFKATSTLLTGLLGLAVPMYMAFYPDLARAIAARDVDEVRRLKRRLTGIGLALGGASAAGTALLGPWLLRLVYGDALSVAATDVRIMGLAMLGLCVHWANPLFTSLGKPLRSTAILVVSMIAKLGTMVALVPVLGSTGAAIGFTVYFAVTIVSSFVFARDHEGLLRTLPAPMQER